ncbi:hypothetical protein V8E55_002785 [Tylopilus felleus]
MSDEPHAISYVDAPRQAPVREDEQPSTSGGHKPPDPNSELEEPVIDSQTRSEDDKDDLLQCEVPSSTPKPLFDYDEVGVSSAHPSENRESPLGHDPISQPLDALPVITPSGVCPEEENHDTIKSSPPKLWLRTRFRRNNKDPTPKQDQSSTELRRPVLRFRPRSSGNVNAANEQISIIAKGRREPRQPPGKTAVPSNPNKDASRSAQSTADPKGADSAHTSQLLAKTIRVTHQRESGKATISFTFPAWMLCFRSGAEDGMH